jgi:hypothetical protein
MWSVNPRPPSPTDHYAALTSDPIDEAQLATLRSELVEDARFPQASGYTSEPPVSDRTIIRLSVQKSWGGRTQIYLLIPPQGASDLHVLGVECIRDCRTMRNDASFFAIAPSH